MGLNAGDSFDDRQHNGNLINTNFDGHDENVGHIMTRYSYL